MKRNVALLLALLTACAPATSQEAAAPPPVERASDVLWVDSGDGYTLIEESGLQVSRLPAAVASGTFDRLVAYESLKARTELVGIDPVTLKQLSKQMLPYGLVARVTSGSGLVALTQPPRHGNHPWLPEGRSRTTIHVANTETGSSKRFQLDGNFEPEAFSTDDTKLYTIEYIPALDPNRYRVRVLNLDTGGVRPIGRLKLSAPDQMRGTGRMQVMAPAGDELYTLYTRQGPNYAHDTAIGRTPGRSHAFVHLLNLQFGWAHCIDLPPPFGSGRATASSIAVSRNGQHLYVVDWTNGAVAMVNPRKVRVARTAGIESGRPDDHTFSAVAPDGTLYAAGNDSIVTVDPDGLEVTARWQLEDEITGLAVSIDGDRVYAALRHRIAVMDASTGAILDRLHGPTSEGIPHVAPQV